MSKYRTKKVKLLKEGNIEKKKQSRLQKYYSNPQGYNKSYHPVELKNYDEDLNGAIYKVIEYQSINLKKVE